MGLVKYFCLMSVALVIGLVGWSVWEWRQWPIDYSQFKVASWSGVPHDPSYKQLINPRYFTNATVIKDEQKLRNPQDIAVANDGIIYTALRDSTIAAINSTGDIRTLTKINDSGLMLGILLTSDEKTLFVMTEHQGVVKVNVESGEYTSLFKEVEGKKTVALNQLCLDEANQILYLTESGPITMAFHTKEVFLKHKEGRVLAFDLRSNQLTVIKRNIGFPNGIVYEKSRQAVIYSELTQYRLIRLFVSGPRKGETETVLQNFWGVLDNLKWDDKGNILAGVPTVRNQLSDYVDSRPEIRQKMIYLPQRFVSALVEKIAGGVRIDVNSGKVVEVMFGAPVKTNFVTTVLEKNGKRYFTSLTNPTILVLDIEQEGKRENTITEQGGQL